MTKPDPNLDSTALRDVLESTAAVLDFLAEVMELGAQRTRPERADLPRQMLVLTARACERTAQEEGRRLEGFCEALWDRGMAYDLKPRTKGDAS